MVFTAGIYFSIKETIWNIMGLHKLNISDNTDKIRHPFPKHLVNLVTHILLVKLARNKIPGFIACGPIDGACLLNQYKTALALLI